MSHGRYLLFSLCSIVISVRKNDCRYTTPHLSKTQGYFVAISSLAAQIRIPFGSSYAVSKHAVGRFVEHMKLGLSDPQQLHLP